MLVASRAAAVLRRPRLAAEAADGCEDDDAEAEAIAAVLHQCDAVASPARAWIEAQRRQARHVLRACWPAVTALVARLEQTSAVAGDEAARAIEAALPAFERPPTTHFPFGA